MARIRTVKPEFWEDETIGLLSFPARLLFIGAWNLADDEGLLRWSPAYIKASLFMYDDLGLEQTEAAMTELTRHGVIFAYRGGKTQQQLGYVVNFHKHQRINRPQPSKLTPPSLQNNTVRRMYGERDNWTCHLCGNEIEQFPRDTDFSGLCDDLMLSIDHLTPKSEGGSDYPSNLRAAHQSCNKRRCAKPLADTQSVNHSLNDSVNDSPSDSQTEDVSRSTPRARAREVEVEVEVEVEGKGSGREVNTVVALNEPARPVGVHPSLVEQGFAFWQEQTGKHKARLDAKRRRKLELAFQHYPPEDIFDALRGWRNSPHHCGQNDRGTVYNDLELLLRDAKHIEGFRDLARDGPTVPLGKRTRETLNHAQGMRAVGIAKGVIGNGTGMEPLGAPGRPDQRELARPADRALDGG
jgi:5-methylcytosine-specific restriction endonuclease McrA